MNKYLKKVIALMMTVIVCLCSATVAFAVENEDIIIMRGDINGDGTVNSSDALAVLRYAVGYEVKMDPYWGDLTGDNNINSSDAQRILKIAVGSDEPAMYSNAEALKFYSDALVTSFKATKKITFTSEYSSKLKNKDNAEDFVEIYDDYELEFLYENGVDEDGYSASDICPLPLIPIDAVSRVYITEDGIDGNGYYLSIDLKGESADYDNPVPENIFNYAGDYADCTVCGLEEAGYSVYDATANFPITTVSVCINWDGYVTSIQSEISFTLNMSICDPDGNHYIDAVENGKINNFYIFEY